MSKITFEQLVARREQREQDQYRVGLLTIPGSGEGLEARTPDKGAILQLYGELTAAQTPLEGLECGRHALYDVCPQLRDKELHAALGCQDDPMGCWTPCSPWPSRTSWAARHCASWGCSPKRSPKRDPEPVRTMRTERDRRTRAWTR